MASKPYPQTEETPCALKEPALAYQTASKHMPTPHMTESLHRAKADCKSGHVHTEESDRMLAEWMRPHTMEEINAICDEAEAADDTGSLLDSAQVFAMMESKYPWLCK